MTITTSNHLDDSFLSLASLQSSNHYIMEEQVEDSNQDTFTEEEEMDSSFLIKESKDVLIFPSFSIPYHDKFINNYEPTTSEWSRLNQQVETIMNIDHQNKDHTCMSENQNSPTEFTSKLLNHLQVQDEWMTMKIQHEKQKINLENQEIHDLSENIFKDIKSLHDNVQLCLNHSGKLFQFIATKLSPNHPNGIQVESEEKQKLLLKLYHQLIDSTASLGHQHKKIESIIKTTSLSPMDQYDSDNILDNDSIFKEIQQKLESIQMKIIDDLKEKEKILCNLK